VAFDPRWGAPRHLAERILTARAAVQGERKPVTVLFADVRGSMALAEQVDAEEWHAIMNQFFTLLADGVHRFEGTVNQYTGDGIMALFGAPLAHEDHAQRACYTALHLTAVLRDYAHALRRERGLQLSVRMGLNSGEVVVGAIGDDLRMEYTAQGHTVGLASRMEQLCEPGRVYLTEHTAVLVAGYFELEDLGLFTIKGVRAPLRVFALLGAGPLRTRLDVARARGLSRFVGRADELATLDGAFADAAAGRSVTVGIVAEAGVGKSRLCVEFGARCRTRGAAVVETQALAHGAALPYLPVLTLFRRLLGIDEHDPPETARQKIAGGLLLLDDGFKASLGQLFDFLGVPDAARGAAPADTETRLQRLVGACVALLRARAAGPPVVLLVEDLHWLDAASDAFLRRLVAALADTPILPVLNFRPEYADDWLRGAAYRRLALEPLAHTAVGELLDELLGRDPSLGDLAARLGARAAGNPFFVEELVQSLAQGGVLTGAKGAYRLARPLDDAAIPTSVHAVLAARIDRLAPRDKDVLQTAAVIGKQFAEPVLRAITGCSEADLAAALRTLAATELILEQAVYPVAAYAFKHPLTQEVAYGTQLTARRAHLHAAVAHALEQKAGEVSGEHAALIAYHWERAGNAWEAARWQHRAASALSGTDTREALLRLRRVLALLGEVPRSAEAVTLVVETHDDLLRLGHLAGLPLEEAEALFTSARALAERSGQRPLLVRLLSTFAEFLMMAGQSAAAQAHLREANVLASDVDDAAVRLGVAIDNAQTAVWTGRLREALAHSTDALRLAERGVPAGRAIPVGLDGHAFILAVRGLCLSFMGRCRDGAADLERALRLAEENRLPEGRCVAHQFRSLAALISGDTRVGVAHAGAAVEFAVRAGNPFLQRLGQACLAGAQAFAGRTREAIPMLEALVGDTGGAPSIGLTEWLLLPVLADAYGAEGRLDAACATAKRAVELARANSALTAECNAQLALARALVRTHGAEARPAADGALARATALIEESGAESGRPRLHLVRADCERMLKNDEAERRELQTAERLCAEMGMDELAEQVARELSAAGVGTQV
jgi:class 3 adenylate cyclase/tetratricopeptide (TPR) repeat protein